MITIVRSGRSYPIEVGFLIACTIAGVLGPVFGPTVPSTALQRVGPFWLFYLLVLVGGVLGIAGIGLSVACKRRAPRAALLGVHLERAAVLLVGMEWVAYAMAIVGTAGVRGAPVAVLLAGIGCGCLGRAWQITRDFKSARALLEQRARTGSPDEPAG